MARYVIIGAGAVGGTIGAQLFAAGSDVVLVARGAHYEKMREHGLWFATPDGTIRHRIPVADGSRAVELRGDDILVLAVKTQHTAALLDVWAERPVRYSGRASDRLPIVCAQNAVENERLALRRFEHVYGMCAWVYSTHLEPGLVVAAAKPGILRVGRYPSGIDDVAERLATDLTKSGFGAVAIPDVMRWKYAKLLSNLSNSLEALCGPVTGDVLLELHQRAASEGEAVLAAAGIDHASAAEQREVLAGLRLETIEGLPRLGGSSWQSLGRSTGSIESDYLNGEIVLLGRTHGVPTPVNKVLQRLATDFARAGRAPGRLPISELVASLEESDVDPGGPQ